MKFFAVGVLLTLFVKSTYMGGSMRCWQYVIYLELTLLLALVVHYILEDCNKSAKDDKIKAKKGI